MLLNQPLLTLSTHSLFLLPSCFLFLVLWESVDTTGITIFTHSYDFSTLHPFWILPSSIFGHFFTSVQRPASYPESMTSHIKHTSERDPHAMTRGPTHSLYKSSRFKLPRKPEPWERVPWVAVEWYPKGLGWDRGSGKCTPSVYPQYEADCPIWVNWEFPKHEALMRAWWRGKFYSGLPKKTQQGCRCAPWGILNWNRNKIK